MSTNKQKEVEALIDKAAKANESCDALRFSQAACNAANAIHALNELEDKNHARREKSAAQSR